MFKSKWLRTCEPSNAKLRKWPSLNSRMCRRIQIKIILKTKKHRRLPKKKSSHHFLLNLRKIGDHLRTWWMTFSRLDWSRNGKTIQGTGSTKQRRNSRNTKIGLFRCASALILRFEIWRVNWAWTINWPGSPISTQNRREKWKLKNSWTRESSEHRDKRLKTYTERKEIQSGDQNTTAFSPPKAREHSTSSQRMASVTSQLHLQHPRVQRILA